MLHSAVESQNVKEVKRLLKISYTNVNERDKYLQTPLHCAVATGNAEIAQLLIGRSADVNATDRNSWTPLHTACNSGNLNMVSMLLDIPKVNVSVLSKDGTSALHYLVKTKCQRDEVARYQSLLQKMVDKGADINLASVHGEVPLHQTVTAGNEVAVKFLLEAKCKVNVQNRYLS